MVQRYPDAFERKMSRVQLYLLVPVWWQSF